MSVSLSEWEVPPDPGALIESMRAFGYSLPTAIADLVDNSISAGARAIDIDFEWAGSASTIVVFDDGCGMDEREITEAMRLGTRSPVELRSSEDLGRFGLGLKSAAWSQARSLTVVSRAQGSTPLARRWDLDHVTKTGRWALLEGGTECADVARGRLAHMVSGTAVILERPDRLVGDEAPDDMAAKARFMASVRRTGEHLGMVFHRFLVGRDAVRLRVNGHEVVPWDPFLEDLPSTQRLPIESFPLAGHRVVVAPFVLPHVSKLSASVHRAAAGPAGWNGQQGFYVYRARRLLVAGGWLGLPRMQPEEHYKLARIRIDLENALDEEWQIDVRKARARIPGPLQREMERIARATRSRAANAYRFRGKTVARANHGGIHFVWERIGKRGGAHAFRVNRRHPVLREIGGDPAVSRAVERALRLVEENVPVEAIVMDAREHPDAHHGRPFDQSQSEVAEMLRDARDAMVAAGVTAEEALIMLSAVEPFNEHPEVLQVFKEDKR